MVDSAPSIPSAMSLIGVWLKEMPHISSARELCSQTGISEGYYGMLKRGERRPSSALVARFVEALLLTRSQSAELYAAHVRSLIPPEAVGLVEVTVVKSP